MKIELTPIEARMIGCLIEKQITTPDQYPLSLNALVNACNQKSNRDPVLELEERTVQQTVDDLGRKHLIVEKSGFGSRVPKYQHRFCNTEYGSLKFDPQELAIVCELLLRGPQTPGELRSRAARMAPFTDVSAVEAGEALASGMSAGATSASGASSDVERGFGEETSFPDMRQEERLERLEAEVRSLRAELNDLKARLGG